MFVMPNFLFCRKRKETKEEKKRRVEKELEVINKARKSNLYEKFGKWVIEEVGINPLLFGFMDEDVDRKMAEEMSKPIFNIKTNPTSSMFYETIKGMIKNV